MTEQQREQAFAAFVAAVEPGLSYALAAAYGTQVGRDATADALAFAWERWDELSSMNNPAGYLYRVGQTSARRARRVAPLFSAVAPTRLPDVDPALPSALAGLSEGQRTAVVLLHVLEWTEREAADLLGVHRSTVRRHAERGLSKLRIALGVEADG